MWLLRFSFAIYTGVLGICKTDNYDETGRHWFLSRWTWNDDHVVFDLLNVQRFHVQHLQPIKFGDHMTYCLSVMAQFAWWPRPFTFRLIIDWPVTKFMGESYQVWTCCVFPFLSYQRTGIQTDERQPTHHMWHSAATSYQMYPFFQCCQCFLLGWTTWTYQSHRPSWTCCMHSVGQTISANTSNTVQNRHIVED